MQVQIVCMVQLVGLKKLRGRALDSIIVKGVVIAYPDFSCPAVFHR